MKTVTKDIIKKRKLPKKKKRQQQQPNNINIYKLIVENIFNNGALDYAKDD